MIGFLFNLCRRPKKPPDISWFEAAFTAAADKAGWHGEARQWARECLHRRVREGWLSLADMPHALQDLGRHAAEEDIFYVRMK